MVSLCRAERGRAASTSKICLHPQHLLRALFQTFEWKSASKIIIEKLDPVYFGWCQECDSYYPVPMTSDAIPSSLKVVIRCKCGGRCDSRRCPCRRSDPPTVCTELLKCDDECENDVVKGIDSDTDDDDNEE